jgi:dTDP-4-amino-4,6-dideoxygalactose transaminase
MVSLGSNISVPFLDLKSPHVVLQEQLAAVLKRSLETAEFIGGDMVESFEAAFADYTHARHCVGVGSGTDALRFALIAAGVQPGDAVVTVPNTFIATTEAISQAGAEPLFVDVDEKTCNMNAYKLQRFLEFHCHKNSNGELVTDKGSKCIRAIVPVHLYGQPADMDPIMEIAGVYNLLVIEDACQAHGSTYFSRAANRWLTVGSIGHAAAFSFYPGKNLGACGEAGAVTTNSADLARDVRIIRDHGQDRKYHHKLEGYNGRLDAIQAGFLSVKLAFLNAWNESRRAAASQYTSYFQSTKCVQPVDELSVARSVYHLYVVSVPDRDRMRELLCAAGVNTGIHYPVPLHLQPAYRRLGYSPGDFPVTERLASTILSLPMFPQLEPSQIEYVANTVLRLSYEITNGTDCDHEHSICQ